MERFSNLLVTALSLSTTLAKCTGSPLPILAVPSEAWNALNLSVSGRLHVGRPVALPCFAQLQDTSGLSENPDASLEDCQGVWDKIAADDRGIEDFGLYQNPTFSTCMTLDHQCTLSPAHRPNVTGGICHQGTVPDYYIEAREVKDIQLGLKFAQEHKIPVTVKNTGHDYAGKSTGPNTLAIWTKNMLSDLDIDERFVPEGCEASSGPAVTYGAGQTSRDLYEKLDGTGYMAIGGTCPTVGIAGGWLAGGGHSILTPTLGLGVDNALQVKAVLPNGTYVTANRCQNQDIFFALRGGGGGTFGVVTEVTAKIHADRPLMYASFAMPVPNGPREVNKVLVENAERCADDGWGGAFVVTDNGVAVFQGINPTLSLEEAKESLKGLTDYFESISTPSNPFRPKFEILPNYWAMQIHPDVVGSGPTNSGLSKAISTRLIPRENFQTKEAREQLVDVLSARGWTALLVAPTAFKLPDSDLPGGLGQASVTPAWRDALWHFNYGSNWDPADATATDPDTLAQVFAKFSADMDPLRDITPNSGAYLNEADPFEPNHIRSFWGQENYDRLLRIKQQLDPDNLLSCFKCVGFQASDARHHCYPKLNTE